MVACPAQRKIKMKPVKSQRLNRVLVASTFAAMFAMVAMVPAQAQTHEHDAAAPTKLRLNQGQKWSTDGALRTGMTKIRMLVEPQLAAAHAGKLTPAQYASLASQVEVEVGGIVANCKLEPKADAVLHVVIGDLGVGTDTMAGKTGQLTPAEGLVRVARAVNDYAGHFDHPGFEPIRITQ